MNVSLIPTTPVGLTARSTRVAVILPCYNEEAAIERTVREFRVALPDAAIYVYDNNSRDRTREIAAAAGAIVRTERQQGKGAVVRRMFADVDADIYVMADGDATYDARAAPLMVGRLLDEQLDMVVGARATPAEIASEAYRRGHQWGNQLFTALLTSMFGRAFSDIFTGYRVFSRRFVKSFPVLSTGFEIETEISVHALELSMPVAEIQTVYGARPTGSVSHLSTYSDGWRILKMMVGLFRTERPVQFFGGFAVILTVVAAILGVPLLITFLDSGLVPRIPTAILATGLVLIAALSLLAGLILDTVTRGRREIKRLVYLQLPVPAYGSHRIDPLPTGLEHCTDRL